MARITVEDCIDKFTSRFELVLVASNRARKLHSGEQPTVEKDNDKNSVIALREIAEGTISADDFKNSLIEEYQTVTLNDEEEDLSREISKNQKDEQEDFVIEDSKHLENTNELDSTNETYQDISESNEIDSTNEDKLISDNLENVDTAPNLKEDENLDLE